MRQDVSPDCRGQYGIYFPKGWQQMIWVAGCNHGIQPRDEDWLTGDSPEARGQKAGFTELIEGILTREEIQFVGEEWGREEITIAYTAAERYGIPWANINTSAEELRKVSIPTDYVDGPFSDDQKAQWHRQREQVMLRKLQEKRGDSANLLVVCGFDHMEPMSELVCGIGPSVKTVDYRKSEWYRPGVFNGDRRLT
jgi:hypothetical protein